MLLVLLLPWVKCRCSLFCHHDHQKTCFAFFCVCHTPARQICLRFFVLPKYSSTFILIVPLSLVCALFLFVCLCLGQKNRVFLFLFFFSPSLLPFYSRALPSLPFLFILHNRHTQPDAICPSVLANCFTLLLVA